MKTTELKRLRKEAGFKAAQLSRMIGRSNSYIASLELRSDDVPEAMVHKIQEALTGKDPILQEPWEFETEEWKGNRLASVSKLRKSNVSNLCHTLGISRAYFYQCCANQRRPSTTVCEGLALQLQVEPGYFFGYGDDLPASNIPFRGAQRTAREFETNIGQAKRGQGLDSKGRDLVIAVMKGTTYDLLASELQRVNGRPLQIIRLTCP